MQTFDVFMIIDEDGNYAAGSSRDLALQQYADDIGGDLGEIAYRVVKVPIQASLPRVVELAAVTAPDDE